MKNPLDEMKVADLGHVSPRDCIKEGDLLIWSTDQFSVWSRIFLWFVRLFTMSSYAHVSVAIDLNGKIGTVEATLPEVRAIRLEDCDEFYVIPMGVEMTDELRELLYSKLGLKYGYLDAIRAYLGMSLNDKTRYQCAELCHEFYEAAGITLGNVLTPNNIVLEALKRGGSGLMYIPKADSKRDNPMDCGC